MASKDPVDYFHLLFDQSLKLLIHEHTTLYAQQYLQKQEQYLNTHPSARAHDWVRSPMSLKEVDVLFAVLIAMGIVGYPTLRYEEN